ncbi:hypothetical protein ACSBR1_008144 [Camellia fascicularis]
MDITSLRALGVFNVQSLYYEFEIYKNLELEVNIIVGSHVWIEDPDEAWIDGQVSNINGLEVEIQTRNEKTIKILHQLDISYFINTYSGSFLIVVNPFQRLPHMYDDHMIERYKGAPFGRLSSHVFGIVDVAFREMIYEGKNNSILVSGESGASKVETTKMLMCYLAYLGGRKGTEGRTVEQQVQESNPVLEPFGNVKTVQNNNSSCFGKFVELQFDKHGKISGAAIRTYLLERSRVC